MLNIKIDKEMQKLRSYLGQIPDEVVKKAFYHSANRSAIAGKTIAGRQLRQTLRLKQGDIKQQIVVFMAKSPKIALDQIRSVVAFAQKAVPVFKYTPRQNQEGVSVNVKGKRKTIRHAFIVTMKSGHQGVFRRTGPAVGKSGPRGKGGKSTRFPIRELFSTSVAQAVGDRPNIEPIKQRTLQVFSSNFARDVKFYLDKWANKSKGGSR